MVNLPWLTVLWSFLVFSGLLNIFLICFKLMIITFTSLHLGLVHVCAWCNVLTRDVRSGALFATPPSCGFAALSHAIFSRGVNVVFHPPHSLGIWCFSLWCPEQDVNLLPCSVCSVRTFFSFCPAALRLMGMRLCGSVFLCQPTLQPWVLSVCRCFPDLARAVRPRSVLSMPTRELHGRFWCLVDDSPSRHEIIFSECSFPKENQKPILDLTDFPMKSDNFYRT